MGTKKILVVGGAGKIRRELGWWPRYEKLKDIIESAWRWHQRQGFGNK